MTRRSKKFTMPLFSPAVCYSIHMLESLKAVPHAPQKIGEQPIPISTLRMKGLKINAHLGWSDAERESTQPVMVDVIIQFPEPPPACQSDKLSHTLCYEELSQIIKHYCQHNTFKLIERMAYKLYREIKIRVLSGSQISITVTKLNPPLADLQGNTSFTYGDFSQE